MKTKYSLGLHWRNMVSGQEHVAVHPCSFARFIFQFIFTVPATDFALIERPESGSNWQKTFTFGGYHDCSN